MTACTSEPDISVTEKATDDSSLYAKPIIRSAENLLNPYDAAGSIYDEVADLYYASAVLPTTLQGVIDHVELKADSTANFSNIKSATHSPPTVLQLSGYIAEPLTSTTAVITASALSSKGKTSFSNFIADDLPLCDKEADYDIVYNIIVDYEAAVIANSLLTLKDKEIILTSMSIVRYSARRKRKPKTKGDHDWEINVCHMAGVIAGAGGSMGQAITTALSLAISENN